MFKSGDGEFFFLAGKWQQHGPQVSQNKNQAQEAELSVCVSVCTQALKQTFGRPDHSANMQRLQFQKGESTLRAGAESRNSLGEDQFLLHTDLSSPFMVAKPSITKYLITGLRP